VNTIQHASDKPHAKYPHVYAIVRFDLSLSNSKDGNCAMVVKVFPSPEMAEEEAGRLREVNKSKGCVYVVQTTRFIGSF